MDNKGPPDPGGSGINYNNIRNETIIYKDINMDISVSTDSINTQGQVSTKQNNPTAGDCQVKKPEVRNLDDNVQVNNKNKELLSNKYNTKYLHLYDSPYYVYIEHSDKNIGRLHPMAIGKLLYEQIKNPKAVIKEISKLGSNRIKVTMTTVTDINRLVENPILKENGYLVYVPKHLTERRGVIKGVYTSFDDNYLLQNIECNSKILYCKRMNRKLINVDGQFEYIPTQTVVLSFLGNKLPSHVNINGVRCQVEPYIGNVIQCHNCLRFGHVFSQCKTKDKICKNCGTSHEGECHLPLGCVHCKSTAHNSLYKKCPLYVKQQEVKKIMATNNLSFKEAKIISDNQTFAQVLSINNRFSVFDNLNDEAAFPNLPPKNNNPLPNFQRKEPVSPVPKKRKALSQQEKHFSRPQREYNTQSLPLSPLPTNIYRPSTSKEIPEVLIDNLTTYISEVVYTFRNNFSNEDKDNVRKTVSNIISGLVFSK